MSPEDVAETLSRLRMAAPVVTKVERERARVWLLQTFGSLYPGVIWDPRVESLARELVAEGAPAARSPAEWLEVAMFALAAAGLPEDRARQIRTLVEAALTLENR